MKKLEFLNFLRKNLRHFGSNNVNDAISYYDEIINEKMRDGLNEYDAVASLGEPNKLVADTASEMVENNKVKNPSRGALYILGILFMSPVLFPLAMVVLTLYIVIFTVWISLIIAFGATSIGLVIGGLGALVDWNGGASLIILGCCLIGAVILFVLFWVTVKYGKDFINLITIKLVRKIKNINQRGTK